MRTDVIFWDVDTQYDFMHADGRLYVPEAESIIGNLEQLTDHAHAHGIRIVASADDHVDGHEELSAEPDFRQTFPPHCMRGTPGQAKISATALRDPLIVEPDPTEPDELRRRVRSHGGDILFHKHHFDVFTNPNVDPVLAELDPAAIVLYGVALDVCDRYAVEGLLARARRTRLFVVRDAVKPIVPAEGAALLQSWAQRGVTVIDAEDALRMTEAHLTGAGP